LQRAVLAQEIAEDLGIDLCLQEGAELLAEMIVRGLIDRRLGIHHVNIAGVVRNDGYALVAQRALRLFPAQTAALLRSPY